MPDKNVICTVKCVISFQDGNRTPSEVTKGEIIEVNEVQFYGLQKSAPRHFELISKKLVLPKAEVVVRPATPEEEAEELEFTSADEIEDWKPIPWYSAQLAREPASEEA